MDAEDAEFYAGGCEDEINEDDQELLRKYHLHKDDLIYIYSFGELFGHFKLSEIVRLAKLVEE